MSYCSLHTGTKLLGKMVQNDFATLFFYNSKKKDDEKFIFGGNMNMILGNKLVFSDMEKIITVF